MKLELDYDNKTVKVGDYIDLEKFIDAVKEILPKWKEWKIIPNTNTEYVPYYPVYPTYPTYEVTTISGIYTVQLV